MILTWEQRLDAVRTRADALIQAGAAPGLLRLDDAATAYERLRGHVRPLLTATQAHYVDVCPEGYPQLEDNGILGPGGSLGIRLSAWHSFFVAFEHKKKLKPADVKPAGLAGALNIRVKRMPGDPLPPRNPTDRFELVTLALRWDEDRGWVEVRRALPEAWTVEMVAELFEAYLLGFAYDIAAGLPQSAAGR